MERKKVSRNAPCPCGSGKKFKNCCLKKGIDYAEGEGGETYKSVRVPPEVRQILEEQRQEFVRKYGREPGPGDPIFFDMPPQEHLEAEIVEGMKKVGVHPANIYAFEKTGLIVTESNRNVFSDGDLAEWDTAIDEYLRQHGDPEGGEN